jgi:large subunit ribosomal protein L6e
MSAERATKQVGGPKNGDSRVVPHASEKAPKWYPADDIRQPKKARKAPRPTKFRSSVPLIPPPLRSVSVPSVDCG